MLIINVNIIPIEGTNISNGYIHIVNDKINAIGNMSDLNINDPPIIDMTGNTAYPGFIDGHCHIGLFDDGLGFEGDDGNEDTEPITPHLRAIDAVSGLDRCFCEAKKYGITSVIVSPGSANPIAGRICALKTDGKIVDEMLINSVVAMKFALGENPKNVYNGKGQMPTTRMTTAAMIREQLVKAQRYLQSIENAQDDSEIDPPEYDAKCEALLPVLKGEIKAHIHAHRADDIATAIRLKKEFGLDVVILHCTEGHLIPEYLAKNNQKVIVGPIIGSRSKPELANATEKNAAILSDLGIEVAICTDHPEIPIHYLNISAGIAVREGMNYKKALEAITIVPARLAGIDDKVGSLKVGKDADIVFFNANPLSLEAKPTCVIINGKKIK